MRSKEHAVNLADAAARYLRHHRVQGSSPHTVEFHEYSLKKFLAYLAETGHPGSIDDLAADDLRGFIEWLRERKMAQATVAARSRSVRAWGAWLADEEYLPRHPFKKVRQPSEGEPTREALTPEDAARLLRVCDRRTVKGAHDYALMLLLFSTGLRLGEALALDTRDIDRHRQLITVRRGKGSKLRQVPMSPPVERGLDKYLRLRGVEHDAMFLNYLGTRLSLRGAQDIFRDRGRVAGVRAHAHLFRHGCAVAYLRNGGRVDTLRNMLGHSRLDMTLHYARMAGNDLVEAHELADPLRSIRGLR